MQETMQETIHVRFVTRSKAEGVVQHFWLRIGNVPYVLTSVVVPLAVCTYFGSSVREMSPSFLQHDCSCMANRGRRNPNGEEEWPVKLA